MSSLVPLSHIKDETARLARTRGVCWRIANYEIVKGFSDRTIASHLGWTVGGLELFRNRNPLVMREAQERLERAVEERGRGAKLTLRAGVAKRTPEVLRAYDRAFQEGTVAEALRAADSLAGRIDPIKQQVEHSVAELSAKTLEILSRGGEEMGELIDAEDAEFVEEEDACQV